MDVCGIYMYVDGNSWACVALPPTYTVILKKLNEPGGGKKPEKKQKL